MKIIYLFSGLVIGVFLSVSSYTYAQTRVQDKLIDLGVDKSDYLFMKEDNVDGFLYTTYCDVTEADFVLIEDPLRLNSKTVDNVASTTEKDVKLDNANEKNSLISSSTDII